VGTIELIILFGIHRIPSFEDAEGFAGEILANFLGMMTSFGNVRIQRAVAQTSDLKI